jgi:ABC-type ATPase with predicted acetyltransferase domain
MKTMTKEELLLAAKQVADGQAYDLLHRALEGSEAQVEFGIEVLKQTAINLLGQLTYNYAVNNEAGLYSNSHALTKCNELSSEIYEVVKLAKKMHQEGELEKVGKGNVTH